jgi:hypothetical protein
MLANILSDAIADWEKGCVKVGEGGSAVENPVAGIVSLLAGPL